jgi:A/G-specific adenine glycosylase
VQHEFPRRVVRKAVPHYDIAIGVCWKDGRVLVARRPTDGLLGGLWEFPGGKRKRGESYERALSREFREEVGIEIQACERFMVVPHRYSHFAVTLHVFQCRHRKGLARAIENAGVRWVRPAELRALAWPAANRRIIERLLRTVRRSVCGRITERSSSCGVDATRRWSAPRRAAGPAICWA